MVRFVNASGANSFVVAANSAKS
eukprot:COSAG02_NODE_66466_length_255_cov_0.705128_1_plen_22_part_10